MRKKYKQLLEDGLLSQHLELHNLLLSRSEYDGWLVGCFFTQNCSDDVSSKYFVYPFSPFLRPTTPNLDRSRTEETENLSLKERTWQLNNLTGTKFGEFGFVKICIFIFTMDNNW